MLTAHNDTRTSWLADKQPFERLATINARTISFFSTNVSNDILYAAAYFLSLLSGICRSAASVDAVTSLNSSRGALDDYRTDVLCSISMQYAQTCCMS